MARNKIPYSILETIVAALFVLSCSASSALAMNETEDAAEDTIPLYLLDSLGSGKNPSGDNGRKSSGMWVIKQRFVVNPDQYEDTILGDSLWVEIDGDFPTEQEIAAQIDKVEGYEYVGYEILGGSDPLVVLTYVPLSASEEEKQLASDVTIAANETYSAFTQDPTAAYQEYDDSGKAGMTQKELDALNDMEEGVIQTTGDDMAQVESSQLREESDLLSPDSSSAPMKPEDVSSQSAVSKHGSNAEIGNGTENDRQASPPKSNTIALVVLSLITASVAMAIVLGKHS